MLKSMNRIEITRGDTMHLHIDLQDAEGATYELQEGDTLTFTVKENTELEEAVISKTGQDIIIEPADTAGLAYRRYVYDVQLVTKMGEVCTVIKPSSFIVGGEVTF